jgi:FKBP-type peptidyl-prolyl cis-trans isomerase SlyD
MRTRTPFICRALIGCLLASPAASMSADAAKLLEENRTNSLAIGPGEEVSVEYTLSDDKGNELETSRGKTPLTYVSGRNQIPSGLEKALVGLHVGEEKDVRLSPEEGYGPVRSDARQEVPKDAVPPESRKVGAILRAHSANQTKIVQVVEIKEKTIVLDFNHPYAGKTLTYHVKVLDMKKVTE